ncbi:hypothetical protein [Nonomuraea sp. NPDC049028]|uniref:hypothetical protein n=1 Tax=Nonomuraea sp. NPDC049028 TaxID=3364348 RepID=UPI003711E89D
MTTPSLHAVHGWKLEQLLSQVIAAEAPAIIVEQAIAERWLLRLTWALLAVNGPHRVDTRGRCRLCRPACLRARRWRRWSTRSMCIVQPTLAHDLRQAEPLVFPAGDLGVS